MPSQRNHYKQLVEQNSVPESAQRSAEGDLDKLVTIIQERKAKEAAPAQECEPDRVQALRVMMQNDLMSVFEELKEKYAPSGVFLDMDTTNLIEGGREMQMEFQIGDFRSELEGIVTKEAIAFQETRYAPDIGGEVVSGPMLRLRRLNPQVFREFVCERLAILLRDALRRR